MGVPATPEGADHIWGPQANAGRARVDATKREYSTTCQYRCIPAARIDAVFRQLGVKFAAITS